MNKLISFAPERYHEGLYGAMFVGPAIFLLGLFLLYPKVKEELFNYISAIKDLSLNKE